MKWFVLLLIIFYNSLFAQEKDCTFLFKKDHPRSWTVSNKETIDDIARIFLANPWRWNEAWKKQKPPKLIFAGDVIKVRDDDCSFQIFPNTSISDPKKDTTVKLGPKILVLPLSENTGDTPKLMPSINAENLAAFVSKNLIFPNKHSVAILPKIIKTENGVFAAFHGNVLYAEFTKPVKQNQSFSIYRPNHSFYDPKTKSLLGVEADYIGSATAVDNDQKITRLLVNEAYKEIQVGDLLMHNQTNSNLSHLSYSAGKITSEIASIFSSLYLAGQYSNIVIYGGHDQGVKEGQIFSVYHPAVSIKDNQGKKNWFPENQPIAKLMIYRVFKSLSYGLIFESLKPVKNGDIVKPVTL